MIQAIQPATAETLDDLFCPALKNPAVALCSEVWQKIFRATLEQTENLNTAERCAGRAYRLAMPPLTGYENICDFIACAGYGMLLGAIKADVGTKLLYAAQVALNSGSQQPKSPARGAAEGGVPPPVSPHVKEKKEVRSIKP
ncbi:MAG: hypothetical protein P4L26_02095 [Terracidiphilus sp.]|nr:hypothetical protein [Terracidiphilus sp.]